MQKNDQLIKVKDKNIILQNFNEGPLNFDPNAKYQANSNEYDATRVPAWRDRILFNRGPQLKRSLINDAFKDND